MKLLNSFTDQLARCGELKRVWLTSFTIDIEFIETFILPAVLGTEQPRNRMEYEALQLELTASGIDFRVFCDKRYIGTDQNKRTLVPVHGISPGMRVDGEPALDFSEKSLFHAKVIYIEGSEGRTVGAGSANLTLSGWGRNREVFHFVPLDEVTLYRSVYEFFRYLFANVHQEFPLVSHRNFPHARPRAKFCHSFQDEVFLDQLFDGRNHQRLAVWSPYLSSDLAAYILDLKRIFNQPDLKLCLAADRVDGSYLRTKWNEGVEKLLANGELQLYRYPFPEDDRLNMTHAKLWKTDAQLAIGSWNCTRAGSNCLFDKNDEWIAENNIEAGLILRNKDDIKVVLGDVLNSEISLFASDEQLKAESLEVPETLPFDLRVIFDWSTLCYIVTGNWNREELENCRYSLILPDVAEPLKLSWTPRKYSLKEQKISVEEPRHLLTEHRFEIARDGTPCGTGLLVETSPQYRRAQQYEDLKSLFDAMAEGGPEPSTDDTSYRVTESENGEVEVDKKKGSEDEEDFRRDITQLSYFRLFSASFHYAKILRAISDIKSLDHWVFSRPGCLEELVKKSNDYIGARQSSVFNWFLAREVDSLCRLALRVRDKIPKNDNAIPLNRWRTLEVKVPAPPEGADSRYIESLEQEYDRMNRNWGLL